MFSLLLLFLWGFADEFVSKGHRSEGEMGQALAENNASKELPAFLGLMWSHVCFYCHLEMYLIRQKISTFRDLFWAHRKGILSWCSGQWSILHLAADHPFCPCKYFKCSVLLDMNSCSFDAGTLCNRYSCLCMVSLQDGDTCKGASGDVGSCHFSQLLGSRWFNYDIMVGNMAEIMNFLYFTSLQL